MGFLPKKYKLKGDVKPVHFCFDFLVFGFKFVFVANQLEPAGLVENPVVFFEDHRLVRVGHQFQKVVFEDLEFLVALFEKRVFLDFLEHHDVSHEEVNEIPEERDKNQDVQSVEVPYKKRSDKQCYHLA